jgi:TRAP-type C4-dicarboxylate transport system permease small subunit
MGKFIDRIAMAMAIAAGLILSALVVLTFFDVILRYFFSSPLRGRQDFVEMGMVVTLMLSAPYTWRIGGHISVDLYERIPYWPLEILRALLVKLSVAGIFGLIAWRAVEAVEDADLFNEATNMIFIPHKPFILTIMAACAFHALIIIFETFSEFRANHNDHNNKRLTT